MDLGSLESCSSSHSSPSPAILNVSTDTKQQTNALDSSNSSDASASPPCFSMNSRSIQQKQIKNGRTDAYWEKRKRNNDAAKRSREKRRLSDMMMERKLYELMKENCFLKSRLNHQLDIQDQPSILQQPIRLSNESAIVTKPKLGDASSKPLNNFADLKSTIRTSFVPAISNHFLHSGFVNIDHIASAQQLFHLRHLTSNSIQQSASAPPTIFSGKGAFQPFHSSKDVATVSNSNQRNSPDSSTNDPLSLCISKNIVNRDNESQAAVSSHVMCFTRPVTSANELGSCDQENKPQSLLGSLLARRSSPLVQQSCTDTHSGLNSTTLHDNDLKNCLKTLAVNLGAVKSDTESVESPNSNKSTSDSLQSQLSPPTNSAIVEALNSKPTNKTILKQKYMERRKRNNEAAKRCRANRRAQFEYRARRAQQLEIENDELRKEMAKLKHEVEQLKAMYAAQNCLQS